MFIRPLRAVLVAAYVYLGGLGAASAPMWLGDELGRVLHISAPMDTNTANDATRASGRVLQRSQTLDPSQLLHRESFDVQWSDTHGPLHRDAASRNAHNVERFPEPFGAAQHQHTGFGSMQAYHLDTYATHGYSPHSDLGSGSTPSWHQQQESFGHPGIASLDENQYQQVGTDLHGNVFDAQYTVVPPFPASFPTGGIGATPLHLPNAYGYSQGFHSVEGVRDSRMSHTGEYGQNPGYQGTGHPTAAVPEEIDDPGPFEVEAKPAGKRSRRRNISQLTGDETGVIPLADKDLRDAVLHQLLEWLRRRMDSTEWIGAKDFLGKVGWSDQWEEYNKQTLHEAQKGLAKRLYLEMEKWSTNPVANNWNNVFMRKGTRFDMGDYRIVLSLKQESGTQDTFRVAGCSMTSRKWTFIGVLHVPAQLRPNSYASSLNKANHRRS
ncbi:hypothetical protein ACQY0O_005546 [Thecaphora frezii]